MSRGFLPDPAVLKSVSLTKEHKCLSAVQVAGQTYFNTQLLQDSLLSAKEWSCASAFWRGFLLLSFLVTVFKFGLGFTEPSGSSKAVTSPVLKAKLQPELVASKHLFIFVQQFKACS